MKEIITRHKGAFTGGTIGLIIATLILIIGFWNALVVFMLMGIGVLIGMAVDGNTVIKDFVAKFKTK